MTAAEFVKNKGRISSVEHKYKIIYEYVKTLRLDKSVADEIICLIAQLAKEKDFPEM